MKIGFIGAGTVAQTLATHVLPFGHEVVLSNTRGRDMDKARTVLFISGDDAAAKKPIADLIEQVGLACVDLGALATGGRLQQLGGPLGGARMTLSERFAL